MQIPYTTFFFGKCYEKTLVNNYKRYEFLNFINITFTAFTNVTISVLNMEKTGISGKFVTIR
jgi:hypothetical protein